MARRPSKHTRPARPLSLGLSQTSAQKSDGRYVTRPVTADRATKVYTCPGCQQAIHRGIAHIVVWPAEPPLGAQSGSEVRRHWHNGCWNRRR